MARQVGLLDQGAAEAGYVDSAVLKQAFHDFTGPQSAGEREGRVGHGTQPWGHAGE